MVGVGFEGGSPTKARSSESTSFLGVGSGSVILIEERTVVGIAVLSSTIADSFLTHTGCSGERLIVAGYDDDLLVMYKDKGK